MSSWYFYYQQEGHDVWRPDLADQRKSIIETQKPRYTTILDIDTLITPETEREKVLQAHYRGPFYIDIDVSEEMGGPAKAIQQTQELIAKFKDVGVDVRCLPIYASGSKGFHVEVPTPMFIQKPSPRGYQRLPLIYKHMAMDFRVEHLDMVVYTAGRGRQFRTVNVRRENGKYKVPVTLAELEIMTPEMYGDLVSAPREIPEIEPPVYNRMLALSFAKGKDAAEDMVKKAQKSRMTDAQIRHWQKNEPEALVKLLNGQGLSPDIGFQRMATQVAIAAVNLGWSCEQMVERAKGLIANHVSDSRRYNTDSKRIRELERMFDYMSSNGAYYELALPPIQACLLDTRVGDDGDEDGTDDLSMGVRIDKFGIWKPHEDLGEVRASSLGMENITALRSVSDNNVIGFTADVYADGEYKGNQMLPIDTFTSKANLARTTASIAASPCHLSDGQAAGVMRELDVRAKKADKVQYVLNREGLDVILHPHAKDENRRLDIVYIGGESGDNAWVNSALGYNYTIRSVSNDSVTPKSDLFRAPSLHHTADTQEFFDAFFKINTPVNMGRTMGWFVAAFFSQILRYERDQFPLLQVYGQAGSGKTRTCELLARMHYHLKKVDVKQASGMSAHAIKSRLAGSASVPILLDDMRFNTMDRREKHMMETFMLGAYNQANAENGTIRRDTGVSHLDVREYKLGAPIVFMAETVNAESRIIARSVVVPMRMSDRGCEASWNKVHRSREGILGRLGWRIVAAILANDPSIITESVARNEERVKASFGETVAAKANRQVYNTAVVLSGLDMLAETLESVFGDRYNAVIETMKDAVLDPNNESIIKDMDETSRVINTMAYLTKTEHPEPYRLQLGVDYTVSDIAVDVKLQNAYTKYAQYCRAVGVQPWYSDYGKFLHAMRHYNPVIDKHCLNNPMLKDSPRVDVFRLLRAGLEQEGVDSFRE